MAASQVRWYLAIEQEELFLVLEKTTMLLATFFICPDMPFSCRAHVERSIGLIFKDYERTVAGIHAELEC
jgi:hypothetical protein